LLNKLILHIPHSSSKIPLYEGFIVSRQSLENEMLKLTDWYTHDLFFSEDDITVKASFSRVFCDPERFPDDNMEVMAKFGMGVLYEKNDEGQLIRFINAELREHILNEYYWQHHKTLNLAVKKQLHKFGKALILDCHSFPNQPFKRDLDQQFDRPDFNIGTDSYHTPKHLIDVSTDFFSKKGYSLGVNKPYKGSIVPLEYYGKNKNVQTIMLEIKIDSPHFDL